jgi:hypothetical protein
MRENVLQQTINRKTFYEPIDINTTDNFHQIVGRGYRDYSYDITINDNLPQSVIIGGYF